jgi:hypothetical protein
VQEKQAKFLIMVNLPDEETYVLDAYPTAKQLYDTLQDEHAGSTPVRKAGLMHKLVPVSPQRGKLGEFLHRAVQLRSEMISAKAAGNLMISCFFPNHNSRHRPTPRLGNSTASSQIA